MPWADTFAIELIEIIAEETTHRRRGNVRDDAEQVLVDARARKLAKQRERESAERAANLACGLTAAGKPRKIRRYATETERRAARREQWRRWASGRYAQWPEARKARARARARENNRKRRASLGDEWRKRDREYHREWRARRAAA